MDPIINKDIIEFRYKLIDQICADSYFIRGTFCNDGKTNVMTPAREETLRDILVVFNIFFSTRGYDLG